MGILFIWEDSYCTGDEIIDTQHRQLFDFANSLSENMDETEARKLVLKLIHYCREHFVCEEKLMLESGYPNRILHARLHDELVVSLTELCEAGFDSPEELQELRTFVYRWLVEHFLDADKLFFSYLHRENTPAGAVISLD